MKKEKGPRRHAGRSPGAASASSGAGEKPPPIVGIGASAGGLEAFTHLLKHLPVDTGMAFVLVQHLDPEHESALSEILARATAMPVREASDKVVVRPDHVYVIPPDKRLSVRRGRLRLEPREQTVGAARSIDAFLESLAQEQQERAIGVILSGTASDGTLGLEAIKAEGGVTFAQDGSAKYDSMPRNAVAAGCVDFVLPPEDIARELARIAKHPHVAGRGLTLAADPEGDGGDSPAAPPKGGAQEATGRRVEDVSLRKILLLLRNQRGVDFSFYKPSTMQRRIARRMVLSKCETLEAYAAFVRGNEKEQEALYADLLIGVTSFFRNPEAFEALKSEVFAKLLEHRRPDEPVRIWVAGCSTGQEVYSIAMAYREFCERRSRAPELQIFGSDLNEALLEKARQGLYPASLAEQVSPERLRRFFVQEEGGYRISKNLRERCVFARHNLLSDPPFSRLDLISCRNLLIYIEAHSQQKILPAFHYALKPNGFLFLGASESTGASAELFEPVDKNTRIFCRRPGVTRRLPLPVSRGFPEGAKQEVPAGKVLGKQAGEVNAPREADRVLANRFSPPSVLIDPNLHIVQSRGAIEDYLRLGAGKASLDVLKMARGDLTVPLRAAINKARKLGKTVRTPNVSLRHDAEGRKVNLEVMPLKHLQERHYLILFEEALDQKAGRAGDSPRSSGGRAAARPAARKDEGRRVARLELELREAREYLQAVQEQYEAANEELQASNEEMTSANEELQSLNEELETSKEELESSNEELTTVSEEMANRNRELSRLNSDLNNLQASINTPILVLGRDLRIRRFTPLAERVFNLLAGDVGRPLSDIRHNLAFAGLDELIAEAIGTISAREREVQDTAGNWYVLRVRPYLTLDNQIDGAVLLLVDVNVLKQTEQKIRQARDFAEAVIASVPPLVVLEPDLRVRNANQAFYAAFGVTAEQTEGRLIYELGNGQWKLPALCKLLEEILPRNKFFTHYEITQEFEALGRRTMLLSGRQVESMRAIVLSIEDITERKRAEEALRESDRQFRTLADSMPNLAWWANGDGYITWYNRRWYEYTGTTPEQMEGWGWQSVHDPEVLPEVLERWKASIATGEPFDMEFPLRGADGRFRWFLTRVIPVKESAGTVVRWFGTNTEVSEQREAREVLARSKEELERSVQERTAKLREMVSELEHFSYTITHDMRAPLRAMRGFAELMADACSGCQEKDGKEFLRRIAKAADRMDLLITDALQYSKVVRQELVLAPVDAAVLLRGILDSYPELQPDKAQIEIVGEMPLVMANEAGLTQCFSNLLGNAVKFVKPGQRPRVRIRTEPREGWVRLWFEDQGIGIAKEMLPRVFEMFSRGHQSYEGTGVGLALVRKVMERMGGKAGVESEEGHGSRFWLELRAR